MVGNNPDLSTGSSSETMFKVKFTSCTSDVQRHESFSKCFSITMKHLNLTLPATSFSTGPECSVITAVVTHKTIVILTWTVEDIERIPSREASAQYCDCLGRYCNCDTSHWQLKMWFLCSLARWDIAVDHIAISSIFWWDVQPCFCTTNDKWVPHHTKTIRLKQKHQSPGGAYNFSWLWNPWKGECSGVGTIQCRRANKDASRASGRLVF